LTEHPFHAAASLTASIGLFQTPAAYQTERHSFKVDKNAVNIRSLDLRTAQDSKALIAYSTALGLRLLPTSWRTIYGSK